MPLRRQGVSCFGLGCLTVIIVALLPISLVAGFAFAMFLDQSPDQERQRNTAAIQQVGDRKILPRLTVEKVAGGRPVVEVKIGGGLSNWEWGAASARREVLAGWSPKAIRCYSYEWDGEDVPQEGRAHWESVARTIFPDAPPLARIETALSKTTDTTFTYKSIPIIISRDATGGAVTFGWLPEN